MTAIYIVKEGSVKYWRILPFISYGERIGRDVDFKQYAIFKLTFENSTLN